MVMVVAVDRGRLVAGDAVAGVHPLHQPQVRERLERAIDGRDSHAPARLAQPVVVLLRAQAAVLATEELDDGLPRPTAAVARANELGECRVAPSHSTEGIVSPRVRIILIYEAAPS